MYRGKNVRNKMFYKNYWARSSKSYEILSNVLRKFQFLVSVGNVEVELLFGAIYL